MLAVLGGGLLLGVVFLALPSQHAYAADATWKDENTITYLNQTFTGPTESTISGRKVYSYSADSTCPDPNPRAQAPGDIIRFDHDPTANGAKRDSAQYLAREDRNGQCLTQAPAKTISIGGTTAGNQSSTLTGAWVNSRTITVNGQTFDGPYIGEGTNTAYVSRTALNCDDPNDRSIQLKKYDVIEFAANPTAQGGNPSQGFYDDWMDSPAATSGYNTAQGTCMVKNNQAIRLTNVSVARLTDAQAACVGTDNGDGSAWERCMQTQTQRLCQGAGADVVESCVERQRGVTPAGGIALTNNALLDTQNAVAANPADTTPTCEASGFNLSWIACPIFNGLAGFTSWVVDNILTPMLRTSPISTDGSDNIYKVWSNFRIYGNIFLIIALIVIVFGQSIGGGFVDAYTAKKVLPRLLIASVLINLSIYIVAGLVDITNVIGGGIGQLMTAPINDAGAFTIKMSGGGADIVGATAIFGGIAGLGALLGGVTVMPFILLFIVLPVALSVVMIIITLILRQALITALVLVSPVAFALYCLPNTEKYFKKWWELLLQTLIVYPIVIVFFSVASILSVTVDPAASAANTIISLMLQFLPLMFVPYAFKLAGGVLGRIHDLAAGKAKQGMEAVKGNPNDPNSLRNRVKYNTRSSYNAARSEAYGALSGKTKGDGVSSRGGRLKRGAYGLLARGVGYGNLEGERAQYNEQQEKIIAAQYSQGGDNTVRAYWAKQATAEEAADGSGRQEGRYYSPYQSADGTYKEWSKADVDKAHRIVGNDQSRVQSYAKYEMGKAANDGQLENFEGRFISKSNEMGWSSDTANGVYAGIKFAHQQTRKERKYQSIGGSAGSLHYTDIDHAGLSNELADTTRRGDFASFRSSTGREALKGYQEAASRIASGPAAYAAGPDGKSEFNMATDQAVVKNYQEVADSLDKVFSGSPRAQRAGQISQQVQAAQGEDEAFGGYGIGASARAETAWREFTDTVKGRGGGSGGGTPPPAAPSGGGSSGPTTPSSPPPGQFLGSYLTVPQILSVFKSNTWSVAGNGWI
ncbi:MAG: rane protein of unknown function [Candidatus Saccharibacteria bacterium]|nr:rane protein of unknown function [Candidatus Saccharibacteria bacterium]